MIVADQERIYHKCCFIVEADGRWIKPAAENVHGISENICNTVGVPEFFISNIFARLAKTVDLIVCHDVKFDLTIMQALFRRQGQEMYANALEDFPSYCTMEHSTEYCKLPPFRYGSWKWPKLDELYKILFEEDLEDAHDALVDTEAMMRCYFKLKELGL